MPDSSDVHEDTLLDEVKITFPDENDAKKRRKRRIKLIAEHEAEVAKYNHNHGGDGRFAGFGVTAVHVSVDSKGDLGPDTREQITDSTDAINSVLRTPNIKNVTVQVRSVSSMPGGGGVVAGFYSPVSPGKITVSGRAKSVDIVHEYAHMLDYEQLSSRGAGSASGAMFLEQAGTRNPALLNLGHMIKASPEYRKGFHGTVREYANSNSEVFARAFTQHIANKSGDKQLLAAVHEDSNQWSEDNFKPIGEAMDAYFSSEGLTYGSVLKYNQNHDENGRFASGSGGGGGIVKVTPGTGRPEDFVGTRMAHQAPTNDGFSVPMHKVGEGNMFPADVLSEHGARYYGDNSPRDHAVVATMRKVQGKPHEKVTVYRTINAFDNGDLPKAELRPGDWVTPSLSYAEGHARSDRPFVIVQADVPASHLYTDANSLQEWGFDPTPDSAIQKYNPNHDGKGQFATGHGSGVREVTYPTATGGRISRADAAEEMYGTGSKQHVRALRMDGREHEATKFENLSRGPHTWKTGLEATRAIEARHKGVDIWLSDPTPNTHPPMTSSLSMLEVAKEHRGKGLAEAAMTDATAWADHRGVTLTATPVSEFGSSKKRLIAWNKKHGFVENKGRNKDYQINDTMYRLPQSDVTKGKVAHMITPFDDWSGKSRDEILKAYEGLGMDAETADAYTAVLLGEDAAETTTPEVLDDLGTFPVERAAFLANLSGHADFQQAVEKAVESGATHVQVGTTAEGDFVVKSIVPVQPVDSDAPMFKSVDEDKRFTFGPMYVPGQYDAHGDWAEADDLQKAVWDFSRGDRLIALQHHPELGTMGEAVEMAVIPFEHDVEMKKADGTSETVHFPAGTPWLGVVWDKRVWPFVKNGDIRGYSIGGRASLLDVSIPGAEAV